MKLTTFSDQVKPGSSPSEVDINEKRIMLILEMSLMTWNNRLLYFLTFWSLMLKIALLLGYFYFTLNLDIFQLNENVNFKMSIEFKC